MQSGGMESVAWVWFSSLRQCGDEPSWVFRTVVSCFCEPSATGQTTARLLEERA